MSGVIVFLPIILILLAFTSCVRANEAPVVSNVQAAQRTDDSGLVDITFDLFDTDGDAMTLQLFLSEDGGATFPVECLSVTPPPGSSFTSGSNRSLIWDARTDHPNHQGSYQVRVQADDLQGTPPPVGFVLISASSFWMGAQDGEDDAQSDEYPRHQVTLTRAFHLQATEVTNQQYADMAQWAYDIGYCAVTSNNDSLIDTLDGSMDELLDLNDGDCEISFSSGHFTVDSGKEDHPVKEVTWYGAAAYCDWLSLQTGLFRAYDHGNWQCNGGDPYGASGYRLPTEAEWEYACRAGTDTPFSTGDCLEAGTEANYNGNGPYSGCPSGPYEEWTMPVSSYPANDWGLYDMHGNLYEWCNDWYDSDYYDSSQGSDPPGPDRRLYRVERGGSWGYFAWRCRSADRVPSDPSSCHRSIGFRPARTAE
ncbi:MAG: formylglycine-generating enzyme family protein [bacterium]|nr:formylglycine-generating enzyme family protein [bacterium]